MSAGQRRFEVRVAAQAEKELWAIVEGIQRDSILNARQFGGKLRRAIEALARFPERHPAAPEGLVGGVQARQVVVGNYRVIFVVLNRIVHVVGIRHAARLPIDGRYLASEE